MVKQTIPYAMSVLGFDISIKSERLSNVKVWRPTLPVILGNGDRHVECLGIVDSGADFVSFSRSVADSLGLRLEAPVTTTGVGGGMVTHFHPVTLELPSIIGASSFAVNVAFLDDFGWKEGYTDVGLLGQNGFFDRFKVAFDFRQKSFDIESFD